ncbi:transposase [Frisingicoccus sp.]|uniref:transposase n=1 Tax=Frisingicoccus sp. TaxID=1918627 RepID=UPI003AB3D2D7
MSEKNYYSMTTKRFTLRTSHNEWLLITRRLYNDVLYFYYKLFLEHPELNSLTNQKAMRALECMSIVGRDKKPVEVPLPWKGVPLYFRRAAINSALAAGRSYLARSEQTCPSQEFSSGITLYKGMYKDLDSHSVMVKVWNGEKWCWIHGRLSGSEIPADALCLSPRMVFHEKRIELHVPIRQDVLNRGTLKQRIGREPRICAVQFTNGDSVAVCCVMNPDYAVEAVKFFRGGTAYRNRCQGILDKIEKSKKASPKETSEDADKKYWKKLRNIHEDISHQISRKIVDFSRENQAEIIILPKYDSAYSKYVMAAVGKWSPLYISHSIRRQLQYKAWQEGIFVLDSSVSDIGRVCAKCGAPVQRRGELFLCENGHQGNRWINSACNLGKKAYESLGKNIPIRASRMSDAPHGRAPSSSAR